MSYDVLKLVRKLEEGYFEAEPGVIFPATVKRIQEVLAGEPPVEIVSAGWNGRPDREPVADKFLREAESYPMGAWSLALMPYTQDQSELRARVLAFVESWFKRALTLAVGAGPHAVLGAGVRLHIAKNLDYRR